MIRNLKLVLFISAGIFVFFILLNALEKTNNYSPIKFSNKIETNFTARLLYKNEEVSLEELIKDQHLSIINIWASWCLPCREEHSYLLNLNSINNTNIIGINYKDNEVNAKKFLRELVQRTLLNLLSFTTPNLCKSISFHSLLVVLYEDIKIEMEILKYLLYQTLPLCHQT